MLTQFKQKEFWLSQLKTLLLIVVIASAIAFYQQRDMRTGIAPGINARLISGEHMDLEQTLTKGPVLVYFWGSWCSVCRLVSPAVDSIAGDGVENGYSVITIALSSGSDAAITDYLAEHQYHFDTVNDHNSLYGKEWGVAVTPSIFILNQQGEISYVSTGITSQWGMRLRLWLAGLEKTVNFGNYSQ